VLCVGTTIASAAPRLAIWDLDRQATQHTFSELRNVPTAVVVWKASCAPCLEDLANLREIAARAPGWRIVTLALDDAKTARQAMPPQARGLGSRWHTVEPPAQVLAALNPSQPALPLTIAVDTSGEICARRVGLLGSDVLVAWRTQCSK
jgi:hypothetical protein